MSTSYKVSADDASAMAKIWYQLAGVANPSQKAIDWWTKQIQQDGSHTAFLNFSNGKGQDAQSQFDPAVLQQNAQKLKVAANVDPWQPDPTTPQLAGTNTKNLAGLANAHPVLAALYGGGGNPITGAGIYNASHSGGTGLDYLKGAAVAAAVPAAVSGVGALTGAAAGAGAASSAIPDAATMDPGALAGVADATGGAAAPSTLGLAGTAAGAANTASGIAGTGLTTADILKLGGSALTAGTNYAENAASLAERKREFDASNALAAQNTAAGEGQIAAQTQAKLNSAPLADRSQFMLKALQAAPPTTFQPRDYTQAGGTANLNGQATGGAAAQLAANQAASAQYKPGAGGVDTSALQLLLSKLKGSGSAYGTMPTTGGVG